MPRGLICDCETVSFTNVRIQLLFILALKQHLTRILQNICGTDPHPVKYRAKKYKIAERSFGLSDFRQMMSHLPEHVPDTEIREMFMYADKDRDGRISYEEFLVGRH